MKNSLLNLVIFQLGWLVCVIGGNVYALVYTGVALVIHQLFLVNNKAEWKLIAIILVGGCLWEFLIIQLDVMRYDDADILGLPIWLICLWALFATTFLHGLAWMSRYLWLAALLAAVFGPASYWAGTGLNNAQFGLSLPTALGLIALGWALLFPSALYLSMRFKS